MTFRKLIDEGKAMNIVEELFEKIKYLPDEKVREVSAYTDYIIFHLQNSSSHIGAKKKMVHGFGSMKDEFTFSEDFHAPLEYDEEELFP